MAGETVKAFREAFWQPPPPHGATIHDGVVSNLERQRGIYSARVYGTVAGGSGRGQGGGRMMQNGDGGSNFHKLLGRALTDHEFRDALMDPEQQASALESMGVQATEDVLEALNAAIEALNNLAQSETLGGDINAVA
jgi:hypothetical protein